MMEFACGARPRRNDARRPVAAYCLSLMLLASPDAPIAGRRLRRRWRRRPDMTKRILVLPAVQWNATGSTWQYAVQPDPQPTRDAAWAG